MKILPDRDRPTYVAENGHVTVLKAFRMPQELIARIEAAQEHYGLETFTECVFQMIERGMSTYQVEDGRLEIAVEAATSEIEIVPRRTNPRREPAAKIDRLQKVKWMELLRSCYQFMDRDDFISEGVPPEIVDSFLVNL